MSITALCAAAICCCVAALIIKNVKSDYAPLAVAAASVIIIAAAASEAIPLIEYISELSEESGYAPYFAVLLKALGIAVVCQLSAEICRDCGESSVASKVELAGKISILVISLPIITQLLDTAKGILK